jgi:cysteine desulfurase/selenocysteine lyase
MACGNVRRVGAVESFKHHFPIFENESNQALAYFDSASSAQKPQHVIEAMNRFQTSSYANVHRGLYRLSAESTTAYENARRTVANFIATDENNIVFTRSATEAINLVASTWGTQHIKAGDIILLTEMEHHANIVPWVMLAKQVGAKVEYASLLPDGSLDMKSYEKALENKPKLVAFAHISNVLGTINPVKNMVSQAHNAGAKTIIDGSQAAPHIKLDMADIDSDFYVFTGHKTYGPTGTGVLYGKKELLDAMPPWQGGGDMIETVAFDNITFAKAPAKFEAGTPNIVGTIGLAASIEFLNEIGWGAIETHEKALSEKLEVELTNFNGLTLYSRAANKIGVFSFNLDGIHSSDAAMVLDKCNVAVRTGHHCAQPLMKALGTEHTIRASIGLSTTEDDIDQLISALHKAQKMLG